MKKAKTIFSTFFWKKESGAKKTGMGQINAPRL